MLAFGPGCASNTAPHGWLPTAGEATHDGFGSWVEVGLRGQKRDIDGELIAVSSDRLTVLSGGELIGIHMTNITLIKVTTFQSQHAIIGWWAFLGFLSTASHGFGLVLSGPAWIVIGSISAVAASNHPQTLAYSGQWAKLRKFARFPQGLPESVDSLRGKGGR
jgi:hypothetical protein